MTAVSAETVITALTIAAGLALGIERSLELLKHFMDSGNGSLTPKEQKGVLEKTQLAIQEAEDAIAGKGVQVARRNVVLASSQVTLQVNQTVADSEASEKKSIHNPKYPLFR